MFNKLFTRPDTIVGRCRAAKKRFQAYVEDPSIGIDKVEETIDACHAIQFQIHDIFRDDEYREYFRELRAYHVMNGCILSHIPVHEASLGRFGVNIHGHLHASRVKKARGVDAKTGATLYSTEIDPRYHCVCVELTDFTPILFEDVIRRIEAEGGVVGFKSGNGPAM